MEHRNTDWIDERTAALAPPADWRPDEGAARLRMHARMHEESAPGFHPRIRWVAVAALGCAALAALPKPLVMAQQAWQLLTVRRVEVVHVDLNRLPKEARSLREWNVSQRGAASVFRSAQEVAAQTGFSPRVPNPGVVNGLPQLAVMGPVSFSTTLQRTHVELALRHAGINDQAIPAEWDGAHLAIHFGAVAISEWQGTTLMELNPPVFSAPSGFDVSRFAALTLRAAGVAAEEAIQVAARLASAPAVVLAVPADERVAVREVQLRAGPGTLIRDESEDPQGQRVTLVWSTVDRMFVVSTAYSEDFAIRFADALTR